MEKKILTHRFRKELRKLTLACGGQVAPACETLIQEFIQNDRKKLISRQISYYQEFWYRGDRGIGKILRATAEGNCEEKSGSHYVFKAETYVGSCLTTQTHFASTLMRVMRNLGLFSEVLYDSDTAGLKIKVFW